MADLAPFPVDDDVLNRIEEAIGTRYGVMREDGTHELVGGEFTLTALLGFYSGYDESKLIDLGTAPDPMGFGHDVQWSKYPEPVYSERDVIAALIAEVRRLRAVQVSRTGSETEHDDA